MSDSIRHRGPDDSGFYDGDSVGLGMRRLSIIDVTHGEQPVRSESGDIVAVFNGEIYNFAALREMLVARGHRLASSSDSECIPHLYEEYGLDFVQHLRGMFAIALWDEARGRLVLARDRLGKKPLYYRENGGLAFASELKGVLRDPSTPRDVDLHALSDYLTYQYVPAPRSIYRSVKKLPPAHILVHEGGRTTVTRYWSLSFAGCGPTTNSEHELSEQLREQLLDSVRVRLVSERPLGAFLSGGLDSSAIVAAMSRLSGSVVNTFSIGFDDDRYNELPYAKQVAELYGTEHHELVVRPDVHALLPRLAKAFDEPYADSSAIPSYYLAELSRRHVVVALNGDGGDEALGGYRRYEAFLRGPESSLAGPLAAGLRAAGRAIAPLGARSEVARKMAAAATIFGEEHPAPRYVRFVSLFRPEEKLALFSPEATELLSHDSQELILRVWDDHRELDRVNRLLAVDTATYLPGALLPKVDITTMAVSLEARSPLLDHTFLEWAAGLPGDLKVRGGVTKYLFKKALEPWLPQELIYRKKQGFGIPLGHWLRGPLREMVRDLVTDGTAAQRGWFRQATMTRLLDEHLAGRDHAARLYALLMLELWLREVDNEPSPCH